MRCLVVEPHADDGVMGCGGLLARQREESGLLTVCYPSPARQAEQVKSLNVLDLATTVQLSFPDGSVGEQPMELTSQLDFALAKLKPLELYLPYPGTHQDHVAVYEACMRSARISMQEAHWMPPRVFVYEVPVYDLQLYPTDLRWNVFQELDSADVGAKADAIACYESQIPAGQHPAEKEAVWAHARAVGAPRGLMYAEQFAAVRMIRR